MPEPYIQCFLFITHKESIPSTLQLGKPPMVNRTEIGLYAVLPTDVDYGFICDIFTLIGITVIRDAQFDPFLVEAVKSDRVELVEMLIDKELVDSQDYLSVLVEEFNEDIIRKVLLGYPILTSDSSLRAVTYCEETYEVLEDDESRTILNQLVSLEGQIRYRNKNGGTLLHFAIENRDAEFVSLLLENGAQANAKLPSSLSPLHFAAACHAPVSILDLLIQHGANVNDSTFGPECSGDTPLLLALGSCKFEHPPLASDEVKYLLDNGARVDVENSRGNVLQLAIKNDPEVLACVLSHIPNLNTPSNQDLFRNALQNSKTDDELANVKLLVGHGLRLCPDDAKNVSFFAGAIRANSPELINDLLKWGAAAYHPWDVVKDTLIQEIERRSRSWKKRCYDSLRLFLEMEDPWSNDLCVSVFEKALLAHNLPVVADILGYLDLRNLIAWSQNAQGVKKLMELFEEERIDNLEYAQTMVVLWINLTVKCELDAESVSQRFEQIARPLDHGIAESAMEGPLTMLKQEVLALCRKTIGGSSVKFLDLLNASDSQIVRFLNDKRIVEVLEDEKSLEGFQFFSTRMSKRFRKAYYRKIKEEEGMRMFNFVSKEFRKLPDELKLIIIDYLSNIDLLVFTSMCSIPSEVSSCVS